MGDKDTLDLLSSILRIGRSFRVNVVAATQLPPRRRAGRKTTTRLDLSAPSRTHRRRHSQPDAANQARTCFREGAFLRVEGTTLERLQAYHLDMPGTASMVQQAVQRWGNGR